MDQSSSSRTKQDLPDEPAVLGAFEARSASEASTVLSAEQVHVSTVHRPLQRVLGPPVIWALYVGGLFAVYYSSLFSWLMRYHWAHQLMLIFFMVTGYAFFNLVIGIDRSSGNLPHLLKLALVISIMLIRAKKDDLPAEMVLAA